MVALTLSVAQREQFNEIANRDMLAEELRNALPDTRWFSNGTQIFIVQRSYAIKFLCTLASSN